jgi:transketolase
LRIENLRLRAVECRKSVVQLIYHAKTGHIGGSLSSADILVSLYFDVMKTDPKNPQWPQRDRFILSKGHSVEAYFSVLALKGFFPPDTLNTFSQYGSILTGHPNRKVAGVEVNTGALGHGLPVAIGMAIAAKMDNSASRVFVLMGDGEQAEGSNWEGAMAAANYRLDNLVGIVDRNRLQISGCTEDVMRLESLEDKWRSFGWETVCIDGHDFDALNRVFTMKHDGKPLMVIANTTKGKGISFIENKAEWHHGVPSDEQYKLAMDELDILSREAEQ